MRLPLAPDGFGRMVCTANHGGSEAVIAAADSGQAAGALLTAVEQLAEFGTAECYWPTETGVYRRVFRRVGHEVRSAGTLIGWEHVF